MKKNKRNNLDLHQILKEVSENIEKSANVKTVFGDPVRVGHETIIPVATVTVSGESRGAGLHVESKPVGYIEITEEGAKFVSTPDSTKIALRGILSGLVALGMFTLSTVVGAFKKEKKTK